MPILIAEDNNFYSRLLQQTLQGWGYDVVTVADGEAALNALRAPDAPRLAIIDWVMPKMDGPEVCRQFRADPDAAPVYILLLTSKSGRENLVTGLRSGADDYIQKPFDVEELRARVQVGLRIVDLQTRLSDRVHTLETALTRAQKLEAVGQLAGGVAHDFNNLLTVISGFSEMVLAGMTADHPHRPMIEEVYRAGERASMLTRQLLTFSRKDVAEPRLLDLNAVVDGAGKMLRRLIGEDVRLATAPGPALDNIHADPGQVEQVIMNLAVNARDAMPQGGRLTIETANVELGSEKARAPAGMQAGRYVLLSVTDTGHGMDASTQSRIFEPFFTTKGIGKGTGLGLATVYGIVRESGGHIDFSSEVGRGTTFNIYFPSAGPAEADAATENAREMPTGKGTVLLVEDDDSVREVIRLILQSLGYSVLEARGGAEALELSASFRGPLDLLLTDVVMPGMNGREVAEAVDKQRPGVKVLYVSGYTDDAVVRHGVLRAEAAFLRKPLTSVALGEKVRSLLGVQSPA